jgi:hypothetical protein
MRKALFVLLIVIALAILWLWRGRDLVTLVDRFHVVETSSRPIKIIGYEGSGTGGILLADELALSLNEVQLGGAQPNIGTTKDGQIAVSFAGKVFPFGPLSLEPDKLSATVQSDDVATIVSQHSAISWPNFFETNFMTDNSPKWKRHIYQRMNWRKVNGAKLEMLWRYEQYFYPGNGWTDAHMTRPGSTGLIRVEISNASR